MQHNNIIKCGLRKCMNIMALEYNTRYSERYTLNLQNVLSQSNYLLSCCRWIGRSLTDVLTLCSPI